MSMPKFTLTITGADDSVNPDFLFEMSELYGNFLEWGILMSAGRVGEDRYPSLKWKQGLYDKISERDNRNLYRFSAHLCGRYVDTRLESYRYALSEVELFFQRVQFNRFNSQNAGQVYSYAQNPNNPEVIVPCNGNTKDLLDVIPMDCRSSLHLFYDSSGGRGVAPDELKDYVDGFRTTGYAGGINEDNILDMYDKAKAKSGDRPFSLDLETGARTFYDKFDDEKVFRICRKIAGHVFPYDNDT